MRFPLTRAQVLTILLCLLPLYAVIGIDAYQRHQGPPVRGTGFVLTHDVPAGARLTAADVSGISLTYSTGDFRYLTAPPAGAIAAMPLHAGTLLSDDDVVPATAAVADVALQATSPPPLAVGSLIDVYVQTAADYRRVGAHIPVVSTTPLTIEVPAAQVAAWLALGASHLPVLVSVTTDTSTSGTSAIDTCTALTELSGIPCAGGAAPPAAAVAATPVAGPGGRP